MSDSYDPSAVQIGGTYYTDMAIQPAEFAMANGLEGPEMAILTSLCRWNKPGGKGIDDLRRAKHMLELRIQYELKRATQLADAPDDRPPPVPVATTPLAMPSMTDIVNRSRIK